MRKSLPQGMAQGKKKKKKEEAELLFLKARGNTDESLMHPKGIVDSAELKGPYLESSTSHLPNMVTMMESKMCVFVGHTREAKPYFTR